MSIYQPLFLFGLLPERTAYETRWLKWNINHEAVWGLGTLFLLPTISSHFIYLHVDNAYGSYAYVILVKRELK